MKIRLTRSQMGRAPGIDITMKSARGHARSFAPTKALVFGHKNHDCGQRGEPHRFAGYPPVSDERYVTAYEQLIKGAPMEAWRWLREQGQASGQLRLICYCREGWFCHTHVLIDFMLAHWPHLFADGRAAQQVDQVLLKAPSAPA